MSDHTPGPWIVEGEVWDDLDVVGPIQNLGMGRVGRQRICAHVGDEADARLIAGAPDLLAALEGALADPYDEKRETWEVARAAIAKAKGEA